HATVRRRAARPAHAVWDRQHLALGGVLPCRRGSPPAAGGRDQRRGPGGGARDPPADARLGRTARLRGAPLGLSPRWTALPALRHADPVARHRGRQPHRLLVRGLPVVKRVGHKGADLVAPGNTVESFEAALGYGVDMIEFDVLRLEDGRLVLAHDY